MRLPSLLILAAFFGFCVGPAAAKSTYQFANLPPCATAPTGDPCQAALPAHALAKLPPPPPGDFSYAVHGDLLDVVYRETAQPAYMFDDRPYLCCDLQTHLIRERDGLWTARLRAPNLDHGVLELSIGNLKGAPRRTFVGEKADHEAAKLHPGAHIAEPVKVRSKALDMDRTLYVYRGEACRSGVSGCTVIYAADGEGVDSILENAPGGDLSPLAHVVIVGLANAEGEDISDRRMGELLFALHDPDAAKFQTWLIDEVMPRIEAGETPRSRWAMGWSNGGAWALDVPLHRPDLFAGGLAFSIAKWDKPSAAPVPKPRFLTGGGTLEARFRRTTTTDAEALTALGLSVETRFFVGGHSSSTWNALFWTYLPKVAP